MAPVEGFEPSTLRLTGEHSTVELHEKGLLDQFFTAKPGLYTWNREDGGQERN